MFQKYPDVMTVAQVAQALGIGKNKVYELIHHHVIGSKRVGRKILVPKCCLIDYVTSASYNVIA